MLYDRLMRAIESTGCPDFVLSYRINGEERVESFATTCWKQVKDGTRSGNQVQLEYAVMTKDKIEVRVILDRYEDIPAIGWVVYITNRSDHQSPIIEDICAIDLNWSMEVPDVLEFRSLQGDTCSERSFRPLLEVIEPHRALVRAPLGGRSSSGAFPFANLVENQTEGAFFAVGWTGQWQMTVDRTESMGKIRSGMEHTHLYLKAGERIRTPRILIMPWRGIDREAHTQWIRLLKKYASPAVMQGAKTALPVAIQNFDRYVGNTPEWRTEDGQLMNLAAAARCPGIDAYWIDALWFEGGFPNGVGTLAVDPRAFPDGLAHLRAAIDHVGWKFVLWMEPERVVTGTEMFRECREWLLEGPTGLAGTPEGSKTNYVLNLGDHDARQWIMQRVEAVLGGYRVNVYRQDFNIDPLEFWRNADEPEREGMTEIRYVEGLYAFWDHLLARFPDLLIDNCASGGRRLDLETISRSVSLWQSDIGCWPGHETWKQNETAALAHYIPYHATTAWEPTAYDVRSSTTNGVALEFDVLNPSFRVDDARQALDDVAPLRRYWKSGDFYLLSEASLDDRQWLAYQLHDPGEQAGVAVFFRRDGCEATAQNFGLHEIDREAQYEIVFVDEHWQERLWVVLGCKLGGVHVAIEDCPGSAMLRYRMVSPNDGTRAGLTPAGEG